MNTVLSKKENYILSNWKRYWLPSNISKPDMEFLADNIHFLPFWIDLLDIFLFFILFYSPFLKTLKFILERISKIENSNCEFQRFPCIFS